MNIAERGMAYTGEVQTFGALTNYDERIRRLENGHILTDYLADIIRMEQSNKEGENGENKSK